MKKLEVKDYSERAFVVVGETKEFKDSLKQLGGRYNKFLSCGEGWVFSRRWIDDVQKFVDEVNGKSAAPRKSKKATAAKAAKADVPTVGDMVVRFNEYFKKSIVPVMVKGVKKQMRKVTKVSGKGPSGSYCGGDLGFVTVDYDKRSKYATKVMEAARVLLDDVAKEFTAAERRKYEIVPMLNQSLALQECYFGMVVSFLKDVCGCKKAYVKSVID